MPLPLISQYSLLPQNPKSTRSCPTVQTNNLTQIRSPSGFLKNVHPFLFPQSPILSTCPSSPVSFIPFSKNPLFSPLLKKPTLDKDELSNYRTISNMSLISKTIEPVVKSRLMDHLTSKSLLNSRQSAYCKLHSTETALLYIHDHLISSIGSRSQKVSCLCLLNLSAAFDTTDHDILITRFLSWFGIKSAGSSHICHLAASVSNVKPTCPPGTHPPAVSRKALSLVHYSSSCTPFLSVPSFPLVP